MSQSRNPETRGAWLWRKMLDVYGSRFTDMWQGVDMDSMQATWSEAMRGMSRENLQRGIAALWNTKKPPTLPEFLELCKRPGPAAHQQNRLALTNEADRTPPEQAREQLGKIRDVANAVLRENPTRGNGIEWAHALLRREANGEHITANQVACAKAAIEAWQITNGRHRTAEPEIDLPRRVPSPHIYDPDREPGIDDDV